jgi:AcrR family transcriptional regulator
VVSDRRYQLKARAERQQRTRERIVAATESLHREVGPARTTIADIARRAGVQRLTVYHHFPDLSELLAACQGHFLAAHAPPDIAPRGGVDPLDRLEAALNDLYRWFRDNEAMESNVHRDRHLVPELDDLMRSFADPAFDRAADAYSEQLRGDASVRALIRLALEFTTWRRLTRDALSDGESAAVMRRAVAGLVRR